MRLLLAFVLVITRQVRIRERPLRQTVTSDHPAPISSNQTAPPAMVRRTLIPVVSWFIGHQRWAVVKPRAREKAAEREKLQIRIFDRIDDIVSDIRSERGTRLRNAWQLLTKKKRTDVLSILL